MSEEHPRLISPHQVVAANLYAARVHRGWTQEQAAERLEPYLGKRWSKATFSAAERSVTGERVRHFSAEDLVAFARAFDLPVTFFLLPPPADELGSMPSVTTNPDAEEATVQPDELIDVVFGDPEQVSELFELLSKQLPDELSRGVAGRLYEQMYRLHMATVSRVLGDLATWADSLHHVAELLERARSETASQAVEDVGEAFGFEGDEQ